MPITKDYQQFLLKNAKDGNDCKQYYSEYLKLQAKGLVVWHIGHAWLTEKGLKEIGGTVNDD